MSTATQPGNSRNAPRLTPPNGAGRMTLLRLDHGCALLVDAAEALPELIVRLKDMAPHFVVRGIPLLGVSVTAGTCARTATTDDTVAFDLYALGDAGVEAAALRLVDRLSGP